MQKKRKKETVWLHKVFFSVCVCIFTDSILCLRGTCFLSGGLDNKYVLPTSLEETVASFYTLNTRQPPDFIGSQLEIGAGFSHICVAFPLGLIKSLPQPENCKFLFVLFHRFSLSIDVPGKEGLVRS